MAKNKSGIMPNIGFQLMTFMMRFVDFFFSYSDKNFKTLGLKSGQIVVDYACGPARYIKNASKAVGPEGKVFATDIHPLAVKKVNSVIRKYALKNAEAVLAEGYSCPLESELADVVYTLDAFHMIPDTDAFIKELYRITKPDGIIIIEDGHQPRSQTLDKINASGLLSVTEDCKAHVKCLKK